MPPHWFQILLSLADQKLHGLSITKDVLERWREDPSKLAKLCSHLSPKAYRAPIDPCLRMQDKPAYLAFARAVRGKSREEPLIGLSGAVALIGPG